MKKNKLYMASVAFAAFNHGKTKRATLQKRNVNLANKNEM